MGFSCKNIESISAELLYNLKKNKIRNLVYRPPERNLAAWKTYLQDISSKNKYKILFLAGTFSINLQKSNKNLQSFASLLFQFDIFQFSDFSLAKLTRSRLRLKEPPPVSEPRISKNT